VSSQFRLQEITHEEHEGNEGHEGFFFMKVFDLLHALHSLHDLHVCFQPFIDPKYLFPGMDGENGAATPLPVKDASPAPLRRRGCSRVTLDTTAPLTRAIRLYERQGYRSSGRVGTYFGMELFEYAKQL